METTTILLASYFFMVFFCAGLFGANGANNGLFTDYNVVTSSMFVLFMALLWPVTLSIMLGCWTVDFLRSKV